MPATNSNNKLEISHLFILSYSIARGFSPALEDTIYGRGYIRLQRRALPKKPEELDITAQMALSAWDSGKLWQNLFSNASQGSQPLPADVALPLNKGELLPQDAPARRAANLEHFAQN